MSNTITISVNVDIQGCIRQGLAYTGDTMPVAVDLDTLSPEERAELARIWDGKRLYASDAEGYGSTYPRCIPTADGLREMLASALATRTKRAAERAERAARQKAEAEQAALTALAMPLEDWIYGNHSVIQTPHLPYSGDAEAYSAVPGIAERRTEAHALLARLQSEARERDRLATEAREKLDAERIAALRDWALEHGSDLLRERIAGEYKWIGLAEEEFVALHTPEGYAAPIEVDHCSDRTAPTLAEIHALKTLRAKIDGNQVYSDARLLWNRIDESHDENTGEEIPAEQFASLALTITAPNGSTHTVERRI